MVAESSVDGLCRLTLVAPLRRVDVAVPANLPVAEIAPVLLRLAGEDDGAPDHGGWVLSHLGGGLLDTSATPQALGLQNGDHVVLTRASDAAPEPVFDDLTDAVAAAAQAVPQWQSATTRWFALTTAALAALAGAALLFIVEPRTIGYATAALIAVLLSSAGTVAARAFGDGTTGATLAATALPYAFTCGLLVTAEPSGPGPGAFGAPQLLTGATVLLVIAVVGLVGTTAWRPLFLGAIGAALALAAGALLVLGGLAPPQAAAIMVTLSSIATLVLPFVALRLGRLPVPDLPNQPEDIRADPPAVNFGAVTDRVAASAGILAGMLGGTAAIVTVGAMVLAWDGSATALALAGCAGLSLLLRGRTFDRLIQRLVLLVGGAVTLVGTGAAAALVGVPGSRAALLAAMLAVVAGGAIQAGMAGVGRRFGTPYSGRLLDLLDSLLLVALVPLAAGVCGLFGSVVDPVLG
ncbi:type VII secretion integral membrane protein EccD [Micromonospora qiuiae]|uniref:Type VII secretion integral membrane protein EccD n=2 Tax=Micromonospora qiuiae TaxID=502268 RepID=A0ABQ4JFI5_9ACTN|nr:type VII secretion integral membrane protein EccD [Micromonospora qiuiae]